MTPGHFYFLNDKYFVDFNDDKLMQNKEMLDGEEHNRPCYYGFKDENTGLFWMIPVSSQVEKFRKYYDEKVEKFGRCDTIKFGYVLGHEKAFLIQNMCPITQEYVMNEYIDSKNNTPVRINIGLERSLIRSAKRILSLQRRGFHLIFPDVLSIEKELLK